jgi:glycosyltransferase involved in cell wall biosynthesis
MRQVRGYLESNGLAVGMVTPFSWGAPLAYLFFAPRIVLKYCSPPAGVLWYRHWHEAFLRRALHRELARVGDCVVYAQGPLEARAALRARQGPHQRVVMAVHFRSSQADEHAEPGREIKRGGIAYQAIQRREREALLQLDGIVYVSKWARDALFAWIPEAAAVPAAVVGNAVTPLDIENHQDPIADIVTVGRLDGPKNHKFLLQVLAEANRSGQRVTLDIYGDGPLREELSRQIRSAGLEGQVRLRGFRCDVRQLLPGYRAYVHGSYSETSSFSIIEAMGAGLPIVAARIGGIPELYNDGVEGRFWAVDDPVGAAAVLLELLNSGAALEKTARAARDKFEREFNINAVGARLKSFLLDGAS